MTIQQSAARSFKTGSSILALNTSMTSTSPAWHNSGRTRPVLDRMRSNGWGA